MQNKIKAKKGKKNTWNQELEDTRQQSPAQPEHQQHRLGSTCAGGAIGKQNPEN